jgi:hypothetical protein
MAASKVEDGLHNKAPAGMKEGQGSAYIVAETLDNEEVKRPSGY